jgi:hypothetical protein
LPKQIDLTMAAPVSSADSVLDGLLARNSEAPSLLNLLPESAQYSTILSAGTPREILRAASVLSGGKELETNLEKADNTARMFFGIGIDELVFSWAGTELAVFGLEGRPYPVFAIRIEDERKRREVFDKVFSSIIINENISTVLDGTRIPQIRLPGFLDSILRLWDVIIPSPFYYVQDDFLFMSESSESLITALSAIRRNSILPKTDIWKTLARGSPDQSSLSLFYSLDRSLPFFLKGNSSLNSLLRLYRQGLARLNMTDKVLTFSLSAVPGPSRGIQMVPGYPLDPQGKIGNAVYVVLSEKKGESRILLTKDSSALSIDPAANTIYEYDKFKRAAGLWCIPADGLPVRNFSGAAAWVVSSQGQVALVNGNMEALKGFPLVTGCRLSAAPSAFEGRLFLTDDDGSLYTLDRAGAINRLSFSFEDAVLRAPPSFLDVSGRKYMGMYPKSFEGKLWLSDTAGTVYPGWPVEVSGIAFGSPVLFQRDSRALAAFITQAGELSVFDSEGNPEPGFPVNVPGVFHIQPVWDGNSLWALSAEGVLYQISFDGKILHQAVPGLRAEEGALVTADVDGDGIPEIFFTGEANALYGYSRTFMPLNGFPLPVWGRPAFADFNGDGIPECVGAGLDNLVYRWQFNK